MKFLKCKLCRGEVDIVGGESSINKKIKCTKCGFTNENDKQKVTEVIIMRKR
jgi:hypothetical protein